MGRIGFRLTTFILLSKDIEKCMNKTFFFDFLKVNMLMSKVGRVCFQNEQWYLNQNNFNLTSKCLYCSFYLFALFHLTISEKFTMCLDHFVDLDICQSQHYNNFFVLLWSCSHCDSIFGVLVYCILSFLKVGLNSLFLYPLKLLAQSQSP